jgi:large subunit ribosomal protein L10
VEVTSLSDKGTSEEEFPKYKINEVARLKDIASRYPVLGIVNIRGIPGAQMQEMRRKLADNVEMRITKNNLLFLALREVFKDSKNLEEFITTIDGPTAFIGTEMNPFRLYRIMEATKTRSPARGGEESPEDITVEEGETEFKPGPIVGELQKAGIPAGIMSGKVVIKATKTVVEAGQRIPRNLAPILSRMGIKPLIVGLDLKSAFEEDTVYRKDVLAVDDELIKGQISSAAEGALNIAMFVAFPTVETVPMLIAKTHMYAMNLALNQNIVTSDTVGIMLAKASSQATVLKYMVDRKEGDVDPITGEVISKDGDKGGDKPPEPEEKKEEVTEEDAAAGLGNLFG